MFMIYQLLSSTFNVNAYDTDSIQASIHLAYSGQL